MKTNKNKVMNKDELNMILKNHNKWVNCEGGERANLTNANLKGADLRYVNLSGANLTNANLDFSCLPLWCGGLNIHIDDRTGKQLLYHTLQNALYSENISSDIKEEIKNSNLLKYANESHVVKEHKKNKLT